MTRIASAPWPSGHADEGLPIFPLARPPLAAPPCPGDERAGAKPHMTPLAQRRPWLFALLGGAGATLLCAGGFALFAPPRLLDRAAILGDARLFGSLAALFAVSCGLSRLLLLRRRLPEERVDDVPSRTQRHLR
jgi:hypothetical protein